MKTYAQNLKKIRKRYLVHKNINLKLKKEAKMQNKSINEIFKQILEMGFLEHSKTNLFLQDLNND